MRLSVLDQSPISEGSTGAEAIHNTLDLVRLTDELGYHRYWLAEHHGTPMLACASPEALIGPAALGSSRIRVGSGGVMLPHYSPVKVAETFSILAALAPDRIDLGLGRAPGTDQLTALALQRDRRQPAPDDFPQQLVELLALLEDKMPADHPFARLAAILPGLPERPSPWLLGSSPQSAIWAAELGLPYSFADFINPEGAAIAADYRSRFVESGRAPESTVSVGVVARPPLALRRGGPPPGAPGRGGRRPPPPRQRRGGRPPAKEPQDGLLSAAPGPLDQGPAGRPGRPLLGESRAQQELPPPDPRL